MASLLLTGCGGSSESANGAPTTTGAATTGSNIGKEAVTDEACNTLRGIVSDIALLDTGQGFDYNSVKKVRGFLDDFVSAAKDVGLKPNDTPDQLDKLKSKLHLPDSDLGRALQSLVAWTANFCQ